MSDARCEARVGVVVLTWNSTDDTVACLESLWRAAPRPARVVLVDNASHDGSVARIAEWCAARELSAVWLSGAQAAAEAATGALPWLTGVTLTEHRGFAGGNNVGTRLLERDPALTHFLLLNNDTEVEPDYFARLGEALRDAPEAVLLSTTIYHWDARDQVWWAGGRQLPLRALVLHRHDVPTAPALVPTEFVSGCALVISRAALRRLGYLAECYFPIYVEDAEYSFRALRLGIAVRYAPAPVLYHKVSATLGRASVSPRTMYLWVKHRAYFVRRNLTGISLVLGWTYLAATKAGRATVELLRGRPAMASAVLRGALHGLFGRGARDSRMPYRPVTAAAERRPPLASNAAAPSAGPYGD